MKHYQKFTFIFLLIFNSLISNLFSQDLKNEMFFNRNSIDYQFKPNSAIEKLFNKNSSDSVQIVLKNESDSVFSIFIKSNLNKILKLRPQDSSLYLIQEAIDMNGKWSPIEFWAYSDCGNSYEKFLDFNPKQILRITTEKYNGSYKTKVRIKLLMDNKNYYSNAISANINYSKFKKSDWYEKVKEIFYSKKTEKEADDKLFLNPNL